VSNYFFLEIKDSDILVQGGGSHAFMKEPPSPHTNHRKEKKQKTDLVKCVADYGGISDSCRDNKRINDISIIHPLL